MEQTYMKEQPILNLLLKMSLPMVVSMLVNSLYNIVDSFFVAKISENAMTALSLVFPVQNLINAVMIGFGIGINAVISFYLGAADQKKADQAASQGMLLGTFHGILLMIICLVVIHPFLSLFTNDAEIVNLGLRYSKIVFLPKLLINRNSVASPDRTPRPPKLQLPFEQKKNDAGEWAYDHRIGLCVTLIAYLVLAIAFMVGKIVVGAKPSVQGIIIDTKTLAELEAEKMRLEQEVRARQQAQEGGDWRDVRNQYSNENALEERSRDDRGSMSSSLKESAEAVGERMQANRDAYEQGLAEERAIRERMGRSGKDDRTQDSRARGRVTVSFSLTDPVRTRRYLEVPAYQCEGGGEVVVGITVNPSGEVVAAKVASGGDDCMREAALEAARNSLFNIDDSAPARQSGTITYLFIPQ